MSSWFSILTLLAEDPPAAGNNNAPSPFLFLMPLLLIMLLWSFMFNPQRREKKQLEQLLKTLKKNDRVVTIGGIIGTVAQVSPERNEVTIKVDDNTRLKMLLSSIREVVRDKETEAEPAKTA